MLHLKMKRTLRYLFHFIDTSSIKIVNRTTNKPNESSVSQIYRGGRVKTEHLINSKPLQQYWVTNVVLCRRIRSGSPQQDQIFPPFLKRSRLHILLLLLKIGSKFCLLTENGWQTCGDVDSSTCLFTSSSILLGIVKIFLVFRVRETVYFCYVKICRRYVANLLCLYCIFDRTYSQIINVVFKINNKQLFNIYGLTIIFLELTLSFTNSAITGRIILLIKLSPQIIIEHKMNYQTNK